MYVFVFRFPSAPDIRQHWIDALRRKDFTPSRTAVLCSKHFRPEDFDRTSLSSIRLRDHVVPSIFPAFPAYLQPRQTSRKPPKDRSTFNTTSFPADTDPTPSAVTEVRSTSNTTSSSACADPAPSTVTQPTTSNPNLGMGTSSTDSQEIPETPRKTALKRKLEHVEKQLVSSRKKIKLLLQSKRRLMKKNAALKNIITDLRKHDLMGQDIAEKYLQVRYYYAGKQYTAKLNERKHKVSRQVYTKLIIFSGK